MGQYRVLLVDDESLLLDSLEIILSYSGYTIIGKASDGNEALQLLSEKEGQCDIALVDLNMAGMGGIELIGIMKKRYPTIKILVLTTFYDDTYITEAITGGADGYLLKDSGKEAILGAVNQILCGTAVFDQKVMNRMMVLMARNGSADGTKNRDNEQDYELTEREKEICSLLVEGLTNKQIADKLYISEGTVKNYISNVYDKTGIHDRVKLIIELSKQ